MGINIGEEEQALIDKLNTDYDAAATPEEKNVVCQKRIAIALTIIAYKVGRKWL